MWWCNGFHDESIGPFYFAGGKSDIFPVEGVATINSLLDTSQTPNKLEVFEDCSHWLYIERPKDFMRLVVSFAAGQ